MSDTDTLANLLAEHGPSSLVNTREGWAECLCEARLPVVFDDPTCGYYENEAEIWAAHVAAVVAESGWLAGIKADVWEEGAEWAGAIRLDGSCGAPGQNPYRTTEDNTTDRTIFGNDFPCCHPCTTHQIRNCTICTNHPHTATVEP